MIKETKRTMSNTIEAVIGRTLAVQRAATPAQPKQLTATCQNGLESGRLAQRKVRLTFTNVLAPQPAH
jgi:hypothetical protein